MSFLHVDFSISGDDFRPVRVWGELVEAEVHTCTRPPGSVRIVRAIRCLRHVLVRRVVKVNTHVSPMYTGTVGRCTATVAQRWRREWSWFLVTRRRLNMPGMNGGPSNGLRPSMSP